jgi:DNA polymerase-3 subunit epsilon
MLVIDIEATGLDPQKNSLLSIGAVDFDNPKRTFYGECRAFDGAEFDPEGLAVCGFSEQDCKDPNKQSQTELMTTFKKWIKEGVGDEILAGQNAFFDRDILNISFKRSHIDFTFHFRIMELHSVAFSDFLKRDITPPLKEEGISALSLDKILNYVGLPGEPKPHNALTGAKVEAEAFSRIIHGKNLLDEFIGFSIPERFIR